jgi:uncharacterized membrane protein YeiH
LDAVGICVVAGLAAFGGGTIRDVLLQRRPLFWVAHVEWVWVLLGGGVRRLGQAVGLRWWGQAVGSGR